MPSQQFHGFPKDSLRFLAELQANNNREWFAENKQRYEAGIKQPAEQFCAYICEALEALTGMAHKSKTFRIHRDVRFTKDKTPYNAHLHISFMPAKAEAAPCWYFGMDMKKISLGAGVFSFDKNRLDLYRERVSGKKGRDLEKILIALESDGFRLSETELKRVPAPYPADHAHAVLLRRKGLSAWLDSGDPDWVMLPSVGDKCMEVFSKLKGLNSWLYALT